MQIELAGTGVKLLGINQISAASGNALACTDRDIPWLQDSMAEQVWTKWQVTYRDVIILDENNEVLGVYNLTEHNLADAGSYDELKLMLETAAAPK